MRYLSHMLIVLSTLLSLAACNLALPNADLAPAASVTISAPSPTPAIQSSVPRPTRPPLPTATPIPIEPTPTLVPLSATERQEVFTQVWETVRDHYVYEDYGGVDWEATRAEFTPLVETAATPEIFYQLMRTLIERLGDEHSRFESPQDVAAQEAEFAGTLRYGGIGAEIRDVEEGGLISSVVPGGPAERAGIAPRDVIVSINAVSFHDSEAFGPNGPISHVRGEPGTPVRLGIHSPGQPLREVVVIREVIDLDAFNRVTTRRLANGTIGLITIPSFYVDGIDGQVRDALTALLADGPLTGLLIDVRNNSGGYVHLMRNTIALFYNGGTIGTTSGRTDKDVLSIPNDRVIAEIEEVPLVVLISSETVSAAEMFAAGMQALGRAALVGMPSAGNTENLYSYDLADGSRLLLAEMIFRLPDGRSIEGRGLTPDRTVDVEWWRYTPEEDPQILAAIEAIQTP